MERDHHQLFSFVTNSELDSVQKKEKKSGNQSSVSR